MTSMHTQKQPPNPQRASPRPKVAKAQSVATPISKKATEYAGPSFNHSPAPASLPPPPFLSKLLGQKDGSGSGGSTPTVDSSPLSFLFSAKQREEGSSRVQRDVPPPLDYRDAPDSTINKRDHDQRERIEQVHHQDTPPRHTSVTTKQRLTDLTPQSRQSPWASIEKPKAIALFEVEKQDRHKSSLPDPSPIPVSGKTQRKSDEMRPMHGDREHGGATTSDGDKARSPLKGKKIGEGQRKKRQTKNSHHQGTEKAPIQPKIILKRQVGTEDPATTSPSKQTREAAASSFKLLKRKSPVVKQQPPAETLESEEDLKAQTANLMNILKLPRSSLSRAGSPAQHIERTSSNKEVPPSVIESDLRRLLKLGA